MFARFASLTPQKIAILVMLALIAGRLGWSVVDPYVNKAQSETEICKTFEAGIRQAFYEVNHCNTNQDCISAAFACPFSCNIYVNAAAELSLLKEHIQQYNSQCGFCVEECVQEKPVCVKHRCISFATLGNIAR